jgi:hypothetical protein
MKIDSAAKQRRSKTIPYYLLFSTVALSHDLHAENRKAERHIRGLLESSRTGH